VAPGKVGTVLYGVGPAGFFLPLESVSLFPDRLRGIAVLLWFLGLSLSLVVRGGGNPESETFIWLYQKGVRPPDRALEEWLLDLALFGVASAWWASWGVAALPRDGFPAFPLWPAFFLLAFLTAALTHTLTLWLSTLGVRRPSDLTILLAILSLLAPSLSTRAPEWVLETATYGLPPFRAVVEGHGALRTGDLENAAASLLHVLLFSALVLWLALQRMSVWKPKA
jgi:hypothetical protein